MGRSQVKYNRTHGRAGTKGRGGRGGGRTESTPGRAVKPQPQQGDNAWRYESASSTGPSSNHLEQLLNLETSTLLQYSEKPTEEESFLVKEINLSTMGKALAQLSVAQRLSIPAHLTVDLEVKSVPQGPKDLLSFDGPDDEKVEKTGSENVLDVKDDADDDLDAWLDTVIA
jgi:hypothetical protein